MIPFWIPCPGVSDKCLFLSGPEPTWARAQVGPGPSGPGPKWARAQVRPGGWVVAARIPKSGAEGVHSLTNSFTHMQTLNRYYRTRCGGYRAHMAQAHMSPGPIWARAHNIYGPIWVHRVHMDLYIPINPLNFNFYS